MKNIFLFLIFIGIFFSCSKDDDPQISSEIMGKWTWIKSSGGIGSITETPATTGNKITIEFSSEKYTKYINGIVNLVMTYKIETGSSIRMAENTDLIIYENEWKQSIKLSGNKLILYDECYDGFQNEYIK